MRHSGLASFLGLPCDLTAVEERVEGGGPKARFELCRVQVLRGGGLSVEAESSAGQTVVAAAVVTAVSVEARSFA